MERLPSGGGVRVARRLAQRGFPSNRILQALRDLKLADGMVDELDL
jgi:SOS response regulatory protein OraA/RecX